LYFLHEEQIFVAVFSLVLDGVLGYLLGSIPTAYLVVRWKSKIDIRSEGSGNVGTLNSFEVTGSKLVGASVLAVDMLKGFAAVTVSRMAFGTSFLPVALAGVAAVLGHCFPVWLGLKGGRGLATAAGVMLPVGWVFIMIWGLFWLAGFKLSKSVHIGNAAACLLTLLLIVVLPASTVVSLVHFEATADEFVVFAVLLFSVVLLRHVGPVTEFVQKKKSHV
jgi:glycerol-3-phosphate acyltransferase PlsY